LTTCPEFGWTPGDADLPSFSGIEGRACPGCGIAA
jgi:hypothetical protein